MNGKFLKLILAALTSPINNTISYSCSAYCKDKFKKHNSLLAEALSFVIPVFSRQESQRRELQSLYKCYVQGTGS